MRAYKTDGELIGLLQQAIANSGSAAAWAKAHDFTRAYVSDVLNGRRNVSDRLAAALGYRRVRLWERDQ